MERVIESPYVALVTGGNRGIGFEVCRGLIRAGRRVLLAGRDRDSCAAAVEQLRAEEKVGPDRIAPAHIDTSQGAQVREAFTRAEAVFGRVDVLVNNAAVLLDSDRSIFDLSGDLLETTYRTNVRGPLELMAAAVPGMRARNYGRIVNVSSGYGSMQEMGPLHAAYRSSKAALNALTRIAAAELEGTNVKVNAACPGWVRTRMGGRSAPRTPEQGASGIVWLATLPEDGPTNGFFRDGRPARW